VRVPGPVSSASGREAPTAEALPAPPDLRAENSALGELPKPASPILYQELVVVKG
jgi:hypothetical protein